MLDPTLLHLDFGDPQGEARTCRSACALFDFSFVGRAVITGSSALSLIAKLTPRSLDHLQPGGIAYCLHENAAGHLVSDLTVWNHGGGRFEVMSGRIEDLAKLYTLASSDAVVEDLTDQTAIFALQGPKSLMALSGLADIERISRLQYFHHLTTSVAGVDCVVGRLGYTGEAGFELILPVMARDHIWSNLSKRARPAGFLAIDILRLEAGFVLFANEFKCPVTAREAGLGHFSQSISCQERDAIDLICFTCETQPPEMPFRPKPPFLLPKHQNDVVVTSACESPAAGRTLGLGYVLDVSARPSDQPLVDTSGVFKSIRIAPRPFVDPGKRRPRLDWDTQAIPNTES
ncbi:MAG: hypothetical protein ACR2OX_06420 [Methyloligellaceae bacterium]